jgi:hypothetical protein
MFALRSGQDPNGELVNRKEGLEIDRPISALGQTRKWCCGCRESVPPRTTDIDRRGAEIKEFCTPKRLLMKEAIAELMEAIDQERDGGFVESLLSRLRERPN